MALPFTPNSDDGAIQLLRMVFGKVMDGIVASDTAGAAAGAAAATGATNMLSEAFRYFNSGVLFFGSIILMWVAIFGVVNTANDGTALGKKWSTFYTPLRTLVSAASLIPTASGYAGVQIILLLIVSWSIAFGSNMWAAVVKFTATNEVALQAQKSIAEDPNFESLALNALKMRLCAAGVNDSVNASMGLPSKMNLRIDSKRADVKSYTGIGNAAQIAGRTLLVGNPISAMAGLTVLPPGDTTRTSTFFYHDPAYPDSANICGIITLTSTYSENNPNSQNAIRALDLLRKTMGDMQFNYTMRMFNDPAIDAQTQKILAVIKSNDANGDTIDPAKIAAAISELKARMSAEVLTAVTEKLRNEKSDITDSLTQGGWIYAGSLYRDLAGIKDALRRATTNESRYSEGTGMTWLAGEVGTQVRRDMTPYLTVASEINTKALAIIGSPTVAPTKPTMPVFKTSFSVSDFKKGNGIWDTISAPFNRMSMTLVTSIVGLMNTDDEDPIMRIKNMGDYCAGFAQTSLAAFRIMTPIVSSFNETAKAEANQPLVGAAGIIAVPFTEFVLRSLTELLSAFSPALYSILYAGYFLGIWIPMIPFYIFGLGVVGWLIFVLEMMAAGVLWMAAHITPSQDDSFIGSQSQGYLLVMSGFFRPALMVLGLVASMALLHPSVTFINAGFSIAFMSAQAESTTGIFSIAGYLLVYCTVLFGMFMMIFALPQTLPDRILKWIGAGIGDLGEQHGTGKIENMAGGQSRTAMTGASAMMASSASKSQQKASEKARDNESKQTARQTAALEKLAGGGGSDKANTPEGQGGQSSVTKADTEPPSR